MHTYIWYIYVDWLLKTTQETGNNDCLWRDGWAENNHLPPHYLFSSYSLVREPQMLANLMANWNKVTHGP